MIIFRLRGTSDFPEHPEFNLFYYTLLIDWLWDEQNIQRFETIHLRKSE